MNSPTNTNDLGEVRLRLRDDLDLEPGMIGTDRRDDLRQKVVGAAIRRADADLPGQARPFRAHLLHRLGDRLFGPAGMGQKIPWTRNTMTTARQMVDDRMTAIPHAFEKSWVEKKATRIVVTLKISHAYG